MYVGATLSTALLILRLIILYLLLTYQYRFWSNGTISADNEVEEFSALSQRLPVGIEENCSVRTTYLQAEIRTRELRDVMQECQPLNRDVASTALRVTEQVQL
jgi:hypothetical protein